MDFLGQPQLYIYQFLFYFVYKITTNVNVTPTIINNFTVQKTVKILPFVLYSVQRKYRVSKIQPRTQICLHFCNYFNLLL